MLYLYLYVCIRYLYVYIICRHYTNTIYHHAGSAKMGPDRFARCQGLVTKCLPPRDPTAVVDPRLRVHGIKVSGGLVVFPTTSAM